MDSFPPGYELIKNNLQGSKEPRTRIVLEDALRSRYNVQSSGRKRRNRGEQRQLDLDSAALLVEEALTTEESQEWLSVSVMHDCFIGIDGLYTPLLLGTVNDTEDLAASAADFAPGILLNPLLGSVNGFEAMSSERVRL